MSMKDFGLGLFEMLEERFQIHGDLVRAMKDLFDDLVASGQIGKDPLYIRRQIQALADHPSMYGKSSSHWSDLRKMWRRKNE